jgi:hypothetical protein
VVPGRGWGNANDDKGLAIENVCILFGAGLVVIVGAMEKVVNGVVGVSPSLVKPIDPSPWEKAGPVMAVPVNRTAAIAIPIPCFDMSRHSTNKICEKSQLSFSRVYAS